LSRKKPAATSPTLDLEISADVVNAAVQSQSGGCLIADAIKRQYPQYTAVSVDMATIRFSDRAKGVRYTYLTSPQAQQVLLFFDQGWRNPVESLRVMRAVKVTAITAGSARIVAERNAKRETILAKREAGEPLTTGEKKSLSLHAAHAAAGVPPEGRPTTKGPAQIVNVGGAPVVVGGKPLERGMNAPHPNLLRGRNRHFGAKVADPGVVFREAVDEAVAARLAEQA
jgi:hypothetical protein